MSIDAEKNKNDILAAFNDVLNDKTDTDWVLLGYEGLTNTLRLYQSGDGGIDEMAEELNVSKIMYAVVTVSDPKTSRKKNILINWQGESAPNLRKGVCARHLPDVKRLLKGVHITVNARNEDEVESAVILSAVAKASATDYNFSDRSEMPERNAPVKSRVGQFLTGNTTGSLGTNYKRTNPQSEINSNSRNKFWELQEAEEKVRKDQEIKRRAEESKKAEKERVDREARETKHREEVNKERNTRINAEKRAEEAAAANTTPTKAWVNDAVEQHNEEMEREKRADHVRAQRKMEAETLIGKKTCEKRSMFEVHSAASNRISTSKFETNRLPNNDISPQLASSAVPKKNVGKRWPPSQETLEPTVPNKSVPGKIAEWKPTHQIENNFRSSPKQEVTSNATVNLANAFVPQKSESMSTEPFPVEQTSNGHTKQSNSFELQTEESLQQAETHTTNGTQKVNEHPSEQAIVHTNGIKNDEVGMAWEAPVEESINSPQKHSPDYYPVTCEIDGVEYQLLPEHGLCARAIYDYQAADETEITFDPGDIITNIDQIDVGWWQGVGPSAGFGLFPANYVELINLNESH